jgi:hypothetical protein
MTDQQQPEPTGGPSGQGEVEDQVVVVGPDGQPIGTIPASALPAMTQAGGDGDDDEEDGEGELRIAQAQLVGWLEGLFHGIQTAIYAQQMASRAQLEQMRRALPAGHGGPAPQPPTGMPNMPTPGGGEDDTAGSRGGMYL